MSQVLVVDDQPDNTYYLEVLLSGAGFDVVTARHGAEALVLARQTPPDLVISDLLMPVMDGYTLLRHWKADERLQHVPFIVYTATYTDAEDERLAYDLGSDAFILKPAEPDEFLARIDEVMARTGDPHSATPDVQTDEYERVLRNYSQTLIRKLEEKTLQLEEANRLLAADNEDLKAAEVRIGEQARLLDQAQDAIALHDREHRILYWNQGAERLHGWAAAEAVGRKAGELHCPDTAQLDGILAALDRDGEWSGDLRLVDREGAEVTVEGRWTLLAEGDGGRGTVLAVNTDVTQRKRIEAQLLRTQRLESIGTLAGGMAHDLNNLLAPIVVGVGLLRRDGDDAVTRQTLDTMETSAQRATKLVDQVLSFARGTAGARERVSVESALTEFVLIAANTFPADIVVEHDVAEDLWDVMGDATQLHQVFLNLCINARDSMPDGGTLRVSARNVELDADEAAGLRCAPGRYTVVSVHDEGTGIPPDQVDRIFEPFFTTKQTGSGTGLGLSTVVGIVTGHGGVITVESEMGSGSVFEVYLPAVATPEGDERSDDRSSSVTVRARPDATVLVVDDEEMILALTKRVLESAGYRVLTAEDGKAALDSYRAHRDEIGLVLTDMMMPRMNGHELCRALLEEDPDLPVAMMSGVVGPAELEMAGVRQVLSKPFSTNRLLTVVGESFVDST